MSCNINIYQKYKIKESIDIYTSDFNEEECQVQFYRINTREKKTIKTSKIVLEILLLIDGNNSINDISNKLNIKIENLINFFCFLKKNGFLVKPIKTNKNLDRFERQISFFDDLIPEVNGTISQEKLFSKTIAIIGVGAVGGDIAILLARAGIKNLILLDYKKLENNHKNRHLYCNDLNIGKWKTKALKDYLLEIDSSINIQIINQKLLPQSDISFLNKKKLDLVINTADEPYIGYTSIKLGRYLWKKNIAMYVAGGFDAHSMSTGEFIIPGKTACIDCYINSFQKALKNWKPTYNVKDNLSKENFEEVSDIIIGGSGSLAQCSLFSASYACMSIIFYLLGKYELLQNKRGEYLINQGILSWIQLPKDRCEICSK